MRERGSDSVAGGQVLTRDVMRRFLLDAWRSIRRHTGFLSVAHTIPAHSKWHSNMLSVCIPSRLSPTHATGINAVRCS